jgi:predicted phosphate transport protein (TIGR00153 family)
MEFLKRRLSNSPELEIIERINEQSELCASAVEELVEAMKQVMSGNESEQYIKSVIQKETKSDELRRGIVERLAKGVLPPLQKEDLMRLTWQLDKVANWSKESTAILILLTPEKLPKELKNALITLGQLAKETAFTLNDVIVTLQTDHREALKACLEVERSESNVDTQYQKTLKILTRSKLDPVSLVMSNELARNIENIGDSAEDTSDLVKIIAINAFN